MTPTTPGKIGSTHLPALPEGYAYEVTVDGPDGRLIVRPTPTRSKWRVTGCVGRGALQRDVSEERADLADALRFAARATRAIAAATAARAAAERAAQQSLVDLLGPDPDIDAGDPFAAPDDPWPSPDPVPGDAP